VTIVVVSLIAASIIFGAVAAVIAPFGYPNGYAKGDPVADPNVVLAALPSGVLASLQTQMRIVVALCCAGVAGWVASIVATVTRRGRKPAIAGIIIGVLSPVVMFAVFVMSGTWNIPGGLR
jgi:hypothetical protein